MKKLILIILLTISCTYHLNPDVLKTGSWNLCLDGLRDKGYTTGEIFLMYLDYVEESMLKESDLDRVNQLRDFLDALSEIEVPEI